MTTSAYFNTNRSHNKSDANGNPPTQIPVPSPTDVWRSPHSHFNPYSRISNNLREPSGGSVPANHYAESKKNPTSSKRTMMYPAANSEGNAKRQKTNHDRSSPPTPNARGRGKNKQQPHKKLSLAAEPTIITIDDDDEDIGVPIVPARKGEQSSDDELLLTSHGAKPSTDSKNKRRHLPPDGPHTKALSTDLSRKANRKVTAGEESSDPIQSFDPLYSFAPSGPRPSSDAPPRGIVQANKKRIEQAQPGASGMRPRQQGRISISMPQESKKQANGSEKRQIIDQLRVRKGKDKAVFTPGIPFIGHTQVDPLTSQTTMQSLRRERHGPTLPIYEIYIGPHHFMAGDDDEIYLCYDQACITIKWYRFGNSSAYKHICINLSQGLGEVTYYSPNYTFAPAECAIIFVTSKSSPTLSHHLKPSCQKFQAGGSGIRGTIACSINCRAPSFLDGVEYGKFTSFLSNTALAKTVTQKGENMICFFASQVDQFDADEIEKKDSERAKASKKASKPSKPTHKPEPKRKRSPPSRATSDNELLPPGKHLISLPNPTSTFPSKKKQPEAETTSDTGSSGGIPPSVRRSMRQSEVASRATLTNPDEVILSFPAGATGAVNITNSDMLRLEDGEFLNDTLIEFSLKLWLSNLEKEQPELAKQIHVFSSFFYKKLNQKDFESGYKSVKKWTAKIDLFEKKYIIVPINENLHWWLAIIYMPGRTLTPSDDMITPNRRRSGRHSTLSEVGNVEADEEETAALLDPVNDDQNGEREEGIRELTRETSTLHVSQPRTPSPPRPMDVDEDEDEDDMYAKSDDGSGESGQQRGVQEEGVVPSNDTVGLSLINGLRWEGGEGDTSTLEDDVEKGLPPLVPAPPQSSRGRQKNLTGPLSSPLSSVKSMEGGGGGGGVVVDLVSDESQEEDSRDLRMDIDDSREEDGDHAMGETDDLFGDADYAKEKQRDVVVVVAEEGEEEQEVVIGVKDVGIDPKNFYATLPPKPNPRSTVKASPQSLEKDADDGNMDEKIKNFLVNLGKDEEEGVDSNGTQESVEIVAGADGDPGLDSDAHTKPWILTLDSLGTKHMRAGRVLSDYLIAEAKDKKGLEMISKAKYKQVPVPTQPDFFNCGVYLLHFTKEFIKNPEGHFQKIMKARTHVDSLVRREQWKDKEVQYVRAELRGAILSLSEDWKKWKAEKAKEEEEKRKSDESEGNGKEGDKEKGKGKGKEKAGDSDSEIELIEVSGIPATPAKKSGGAKGAKGGKSRGKGKGKGKGSGKGKNEGGDPETAPQAVAIRLRE